MADKWQQLWDGADKAAAANQPDPYKLDAGPIGGFLASAGSSLFEMVGQSPTETAQTFREQNPIAGVASEILPVIIPYTAAFKLSTLPKAAAALERVVAKTGLEAGFAQGAVREAVRYAPFELGRLGVGLATAPQENWGDLFADVGLSTVLAGGFGGIGGYFKAGGKLLPKAGKVVGSEPALAPTFELRMAKTPDAVIEGGADKADFIQRKAQEVLLERPTDNITKGVQSSYVHNLENGNPESDRLVNSLFNVKRAEQETLTGLNKRLLTEGPETNLRTLDPGGQQRIIGAINHPDIASIDDLAAVVKYPRELEVRSYKAAGTLAKALDESSALQYVDDGVLMGREADSGLFVVAKRIEAGPAATAADGSVVAPKRFGAAQIAEGDKWLLLKTDKPQYFAPKAHSAAEANVSNWARFREAFQPTLRSDVFNKNTDLLINSMTHTDYAALRTMPKETWVSAMAAKMSKAAGEATGLADSKILRDTAAGLHDIFAPTMFKEAKNPVFGRLFGMLRGNIQTADEYVSKLIKGKAEFKGSPARSVMGGTDYVSGYEGFTPISQLWNKLSKEERQLVVRANNTQTPADDLAKLTTDGVVSPSATAAVKELQDINASVLEKLVLPAFKDSELEGSFRLLDGYIMPRVFKGDFFSKVVDEREQTKWLAAGKNGSAAQKEAQAVIDEAAARGHQWKIGEEYAKGAKQAAEFDEGGLGHISDLVSASIGKGADTQDIVQSALRKIDAAKSGRVPGSVRAPAAMSKERTGLRGSADTHEYTLDDVIKQSEEHYRKLLRFAGFHTWKQRWGQEAFNLGKTDKHLYNDLMRKGNQFMGIEGGITNALNKALEPIFGTALGGKAATRIAQGTNALMYNWNLAIANPTFALLNVLQPLQTVLPALAYLNKAPAKEIEAWYHVLPRMGSDGKPRGIGGFLSPIKVLGQSVSDLRNASPELKQFLERATTDGTLQHSQVDEWLGPHSAAGSSIKEQFEVGAWNGIKHLSTFMAEKSEQFSRMVSAAAMYRAGKHGFGLEGDQLYRFMQRGVHVTNYGYGVVDRSRIFTGPVGSTFGLFKNWQFNFIGQMMQYAGVGMREGVWGPFMWQGASALALGGLGATPLLGLADGLAKWNSDSPSSFQWMKENWSGAADEIYFGLPAFFGASLQASSTIPGTDVRNELSSLTNFVFLEKMKQLGKAVGTAWDIGREGDVNALRNPNVRDQLLGAIAPRAIFRAFSAAEGDYIKSMGTGAPQVRGLGPSTRVLHALGLNQLEVEREQVAARELYKDQEATKTTVQSLGKIYADAMQHDDYDEMQNVLDRAVMKMVPVSSVIKSAAATTRREEKGDLFSRFKAGKVEPYARVGIGSTALDE
jgi:hypothetical protein